MSDRTTEQSPASQTPVGPTSRPAGVTGNEPPGGSNEEILPTGSPIVFLVSVGILIGSLAYLFFALGLSDRGVPGDVHGFDPGSRTGLVAIGVVMTVLSGWAVLRDGLLFLTQARAGRPMLGVSGIPILFILAYIIAGILFLTVLRTIGFVIASALLVACLAAASSSLKPAPGSGPVHSRAAHPLAQAVIAGVLAAPLAFGLDALRSVAAAGLRQAGRATGVEFFALPVAQGIAALLAVSVAVVVLAVLTPFLRRGVGLAVLVGATASVGSYIVFRQIFQVALPQGMFG